MNPDKQELHNLADGLIISDPTSIARCIQFIESNSEGIWHGRARAMMCRRLKHIDLSQEDSARLLHAIFVRFENGNFAEQFRDMLRLASELDSKATYALAKKLSRDNRDFVKHQADWLIKHHSPKTKAEQNGVAKPLPNCSYDSP